jgi:ParB/RepB/Spo0J family partition protein
LRSTANLEFALNDGETVFRIEFQLTVSNLWETFMSSDLRTVAISDIRPNPVALRAVDRESEDFIQLRDSIADPAIGLLNPINVRERSEDVDGELISYYEIIDGLHRYTACSEAGLDTIDVSVKDMDETEAFLAQIVGNAMRIETKPVQYTKHLQRIIGANPTWTITDLANKVHRSPQWLNQRFGLLKLETTVQEIVDNGDISVSNAVVLAKLPHEEQLNFVDSAMTMGTAEFGPLVQVRVKEIKDAEKAGKKPGEATFTPVAKPRKKSELEDELNARSVLSTVIATCDTKEEAAYAALEWVLQLDPDSLATAEAQYNEKKERVEAEKAKRKAERAAKKAEEAAAAAAKAQDEAAAVAD